MDFKIFCPKHQKNSSYFKRKAWPPNVSMLSSGMLSFEVLEKKRPHARAKIRKKRIPLCLACPQSRHFLLLISIRSCG